MTLKITDTLEMKIEELVRDHLAAQQMSAMAALGRAFTASMPSRSAIAPTRKLNRRPAAEMAELTEQLWGAVRACPGETMTVLAARVGANARALHRPMFLLKRAGRVRSAGERNFTRYFPMTATKSP